MKLTVWYAQQKGIVQADFAEMIGVTQAMVSQVFKRKKKFSAAACGAIEEATKGKVRLKDLIKEGFAGERRTGKKAA